MNRKLKMICRKVKPVLVSLIKISIIVLIGIFLYWAIPKQKTVFPIINRPTMYDITLECQRLEANKTTENWSYKSCIDELIKANKVNNIYSL